MTSPPPLGTEDILPGAPSQAVHQGVHRMDEQARQQAPLLPGAAATGTGGPEGRPEVYRLTVSAGDTILLPAGWIHAVHTVEDSLVFGGNFLHSLSIPLQLK